ncbi:Uncharacterised protein [Mycobacteroides abscessus subsp. massiliense]|nr:Uncharacterised protein [Mycobacteroides abscessus subsp. massiliense]
MKLGDDEDPAGRTCHLSFDQFTAVAMHPPVDLLEQLCGIGVIGRAKGDFVEMQRHVTVPNFGGRLRCATP